METSEGIARIRIVSRQMVAADGNRSMEMTVECPRTERPQFIDECVHCGACEGVVLDPSGAQSFVRCRAGGSQREVVPLHQRQQESMASRVPVSEIMTRDVLCAAPQESIESLVTALIGRQVTGLPVVDPERGLVGIVSQTDLVRFHYENEGIVGPREVARDTPEGVDMGQVGMAVHSLSGTDVSDIMTPVVFSVPEDTSVGSVAALMAQEGLHRLPVLSLDGKSLVGIVSSLDILRWLAGEERIVSRASFG